MSVWIFSFTYLEVSKNDVTCVAETAFSLRFLFGGDNNDTRWGKYTQRIFLRNVFSPRGGDEQ